MTGTNYCLMNSYENGKIGCRILKMPILLYLHIHCYFADVMRDEQLENVGLYGFSDASKKAYCAAIYLVSKTSIGYSSELLTSETKVAPLKEQTIPRLELLGAVILARLMASVREALDVVTASLPVNEYYFVDSTTKTALLFWIKIVKNTNNLSKIEKMRSTN